MRIDAHNHPDWHKHNLSRYLENMDKYHIDVTWLLSWECPLDEWDQSYANCVSAVDIANGPIPFSRCVSYQERCPERFILGHAPDPRRPHAIDKLWASIDLYDVRICGELKLRMQFDNPDALRLYRFCGEKHLPVIVHIDNEFEGTGSSTRPSYWYGGGIAAFERAVKACPDTVFLGHGPSYWAYISDDEQADTQPYPEGPIVGEGRLVKMMRACPNLYCDMSAGSGCRALSRDKSFTKDFLTEFQDRVLYARDYFDNIHQEMLESIGLPQDILDKIYYQNALTLVPLR